MIKILLDKLFCVSVFLCILILVWFAFQTAVMASFRIPTGSMQPTLQPGDNILVNKTIMGARIFNIWDAAEEKEVEIHRLPGLGKAKRNDVLVFHYPYPHSNDSVSMHLLKYYVKRCIALPGDTMGIRKGHYYIGFLLNSLALLKGKEVARAKVNN
jgi:signal peptidase I